MNNRWYASVHFGIEDLACEMLLEEFGGHVRNLEANDGGILFESRDPIHSPCLNNLFFLLDQFQSKDIISAAARVSKKTYSWWLPTGRTFRAVIMEKGRLSTLPLPVMRTLEKSISRQTRLEPCRANPDVEIWLSRQKDGVTYYMIRETKHQSFEKTLSRGELRPDIAAAMAYLAKLDGGIAADPYGGSGAIAQAFCSRQGVKVLTGDSDSQCVEYMKQRFHTTPQVQITKWDALHLPIKTGTVDAVVTDPPWGDYQKLDATRFYEKAVREISRILRPEGALVLLTAREKEAKAALNQQYFVYQIRPIPINGKQAFLFIGKRYGEFQQDGKA